MTLRGLLQRSWAGSWGPRPVLRWEVAVMRIAFAALLWRWLPGSLGLSQQPYPVGLATVVDLTWLSANYGWVHPLVRGLLVAYAVGVGLTVVLPLLAFFHIGIFTLYNSQGFVTHSVQVADQLLLAQALVVLVVAARRRIATRSDASPDRATRDSLLLYFSQGVIAVGYFISACTKLIRSEGRWLQDLPNMPLGLLRTRLHAFYSDPAGTPPEAPPLADWLIEHPNAAIWMFGPGLFIELLALFALRSRFWALAVGLSLLALHESIALVMRLDFVLNKWCVAIFLVNLPWWIWWVGHGHRQAAAMAESRAGRDG